MPLLQGSDKKGRYYKWGDSGHKYYYKKGDKASRGKAKQNAIKQALAIYYSKRR